LAVGYAYFIGFLLLDLQRFNGLNKKIFWSRRMNLNTRPVAIAAVFMLAAALLTAGPASADKADFEIGLQAGPYIPLMSHPDADKFKVLPAMAFGLRGAYDITDQAAFGMGFLHANNRADVGGGNEIGIVFDEVTAEGSWAATTGILRPVFLGGLSYQSIHAGDPVKGENAFGLHAGLGLVGVIMPQFHIGLAARYHYYFPEEFETDNVLSLMADVSFLF
jgi:hypothetical protein